MNYTDCTLSATGPFLSTIHIGIAESTDDRFHGPSVSKDKNFQGGQIISKIYERVSPVQSQVVGPLLQRVRIVSKLRCNEWLNVVPLELVACPRLAR